MGNIYIDNRGGGYPTEAPGGCFPACLSLFIPGLGQLLLGRGGKAIGHFLVGMLLWLILLGWIVHIYSAIDASR